MQKVVHVIVFATLVWACASSAPHRPQPTSAPSSDKPVASGRPCGGSAGASCPSPQVCDPDPGQCRAAGARGHCVPRAKVCTKIYQPVCGCDGTTYGNDCMRVAAGAQKASPGECRR